MISIRPRRSRNSSCAQTAATTIGSATIVNVHREEGAGNLFFSVFVCLVGAGPAGAVASIGRWAYELPLRHQEYTQSRSVSPHPSHSSLSTHIPIYRHVFSSPVNKTIWRLAVAILPIPDESGFLHLTSSLVRRLPSLIGPFTSHISHAILLLSWCGAVE